VGGPDADFSLDEKEFDEMVKAVRDTESLLGKTSYEISEKVKKNRKFARSLFVVSDVKAGDVISDQNIRSIRPGYGLHPKHYKEILGKKFTRNIDQGEPLNLDMFE
jgi:pseudaminic acid synthase